MEQVSATASGAVVASIVGVMLTALGNVISGSLLGTWATIIFVVALGGWFGRLAGAIAGAICGTLFVAFGSLVGGSILGIVLTITAATLLGGWFSWIAESKDEKPTKKVPFRADLSVETYEKEMLLWT